MCAPGNAAPLWSTTVPRTAADVVVCEKAVEENKVANTTRLVRRARLERLGVASRIISRSEPERVRQSYIAAEPSRQQPRGTSISHQ
jgi:hypothetical protein